MSAFGERYRNYDIPERHSVAQGQRIQTPAVGSAEIAEEFRFLTEAAPAVRPWLWT